MYKIVGNGMEIKRIEDQCIIPKASGNRDYQRFLTDVREQGTGIVEGADIIEPDYVALRTGPNGYLPITEQLDVLTKEGLIAFQAMNMAVKDRHPKTITGGKSIAPLPDWVLDIVDYEE